MVAVLVLAIEWKFACEGKYVLVDGSASVYLQPWGAGLYKNWKNERWMKECSNVPASMITIIVIHVRLARLLGNSKVGFS